MRKLRLQFFLFFLALSLPFAFLVRHSLVQLNAEKTLLWQGNAEKSFNLMQARVSDFLSAEDARDFFDYDPSRASGDSPLAVPPENDPRGLIGYFQIGPDGSFRSPYSPSAAGSPDETLKSLTESFRTGLASRKSSEKIANKSDEAGKDFVDLETLSILPDTTPEEGAPSPETSSGYDLSPFARKAKAPLKQQVYPNPLLKQRQETVPAQSALADLREEKEERHEQELKFENVAPEAPPPAALPDTFGADDTTANGSGLSALSTFQAGALAEPMPALAGEQNAPKPSPKPQFEQTRAAEPSILIDPFRARLVERKVLIFYRKAWHEQKMIVQGFAVKLDAFYDWLMQPSFDNSDLPGFAEASLHLDGEMLARRGLALSGSAAPLFERQLGYPLNQFVWRVRSDTLPEDPARRLVTAFGALLALALTAGLALLYRTTASEMRLSQKRQDFVSAVTHELKTPLTSIRMSAEMLREGWVKDDAKRREYYGVIASEGERLGNLIDNVLQLARLEKRTARFNLTTESPNAFFENAAKELGAFVTSHGCAWSQNAEPALSPIRFDPDAVKQILFTLVENAVKFTPFGPDKSVALTLKRDGGDVVWCVSDKGPGVPKAELKKIFEKFYRVENELTRKTKGTGIGLAMAKMMAEGMGARIEAVAGEGGLGLAVSLRFSSASSA
jgi:signal transduction histidine kinase